MYSCDFLCLATTSSTHLNKNNLCGHSFSQDSPPNNISLMLCTQMGSLCFRISLGLYKEQQRHLHVPQRYRDGGGNTKNKPQMSSKLVWLCLSSVPSPPPWTQVIVQCNHITAHLNIHNQDKDLEEKKSGGGKGGAFKYKTAFHFEAKFHIQLRRLS